jgi:eukaryotic-like serine/threonine-protein kinase
MADVLDRLKTALADRYRIDREIGAGGMATVYLAVDLKLHRKVAVKVLRPELAAALGAERFLREIEIAAKLHHPHILPLHDSGEADGFLYYVMPYVEGESLRDRLNREKQLPVEDALRIAREVADALGSAHRHDVIHRDIKPENILLEEGHAVVADFGIAKAITAAGGERLTETGVAIGTVEYMSPEQAAGDTELDGRSDVYSLGCVLYEMLGGRPPFQGSTPASIVRQHLLVEAPPITNLRPAVTAEIAGTLARTLAKAPADRFSPAGQLATALDRRVVTQTASTTSTVGGATGTGSKRWYTVGAAALAVILVAWFGVRTLGSGDVTGEVPRIVVLPLENLSATEDEFLADGMTEEITSRLAGISGLRVLARQTAIQYKGSSKTAREIAEELDVDYVLEGTVRTDRTSDGGGQVRITPQLIRASDETHLWAEAYTAGLVPGEIFRIQAQIAGRIARSMDIAIREPEREALAARPTDNLDAYQLYLRALNYENQEISERTRRLAIDLLQEAVTLDPDFAVAWAQLSILHSLMVRNGYDPTDERGDMARAAADSALRVAPDLAQGHIALGWYYYSVYDDYAQALEHLSAAEERRPNDPGLLWAKSTVLRRSGPWREAAEYGGRAVQLDPRNAVWADQVGLTFVLVRDYGEAERLLLRSVTLRPDWTYPYMHLARLYLQWEGDADKAAEVLALAEARAGGFDPVAKQLAAFDFAPVMRALFRGDQDGLRRLVAVDGGGRLGGHYRKAWAYGQLGKPGLQRLYYDSMLTAAQANVDRRRRVLTGRRWETWVSAGGAGAGDLGIALAGLGRSGEAIQMLDSSRVRVQRGPDRFREAERRSYGAWGFVMAGDYDAALDELGFLLANPSVVSVPLLRVDPIYDPIRDNPRFKALLAKHGN